MGGVWWIGDKEDVQGSSKIEEGKGAMGVNSEAGAEGIGGAGGIGEAGGIGGLRIKTGMGILGGRALSRSKGLTWTIRQGRGKEVGRDKRTRSDPLLKGKLAQTTSVLA